MFWIFLIVIAMGTLRAMTVLLKLFFAAFKAALVVILLLSGLIAWHWYRRRP